MTKITKITWGEMEVESNGKVLSFKDCKVWPEGAIEWDWRLTGTQHVPGIQIADIEDLLEKDIDVIILSRGMELALKTSKETLDYLNSKGIEYYVEETNAAVERFNDLSSKGVRAAGVFHSTC